MSLGGLRAHSSSVCLLRVPCVCRAYLRWLSWALCFGIWSTICIAISAAAANWSHCVGAIGLHEEDVSCGAS